jgi:hypothetical protein
MPFGRCEVAIDEPARSSVDAAGQYKAWRPGFRAR